MTKKELEVKLEQTEKALADYQFNYPSIKELEQENAALKNEIVNLKGVIESLSEQRDGLEAGRPKWHKVADGDLPKGNCENILLYNKDHFCVTHSYSLGYYENGVFYNDCEMEEDTIAWCEIPQYTEE